MAEDKNVTVLITIPEEYRDKLRQMAAEATLKNPRKLITGAGLAGRIVCSFLKKESLDICDIGPSFNGNKPPSPEPRNQDEGKSNEREVRRND